jgi:hypothetical protein
MLSFYPLKIIVHGGPAATEDLLESYANIRNMTKDIYAPAEGESVQIGQNQNSYSISLSDDLLASVRMSRVGHLWGCHHHNTLLTFRLFSSRTTRLALSRDGSPQVPARTFQSWNQLVKRPSPQADLP